MFELYTFIIVILAAIVLFVWDYWRYDVVAILALTALVLLGIIPYGDVFTGFSSPAVITVAAVMVITYTITQSGIADVLVRRFAGLTTNPTLHLGLLCLVSAFLSAFMNNVAALALMMPIAIKMAIDSKISPSLVLMPIAFASVLGGVVTMIGTPPNLLVSMYREEVLGKAYGVFDYTPVGIVVALVGIMFIVLVGQWLMPKRKSSSSMDSVFEIYDYITELKITKDSKIADITIRDLEKKIEAKYSIIGIIREKRKRFMLSPDYELKVNDILIVQATHKDLETLMRKAKLSLVAEKINKELLKSDDVEVIEAVVPPEARIVGHSSQSIRLRSRFRVNLLAISRAGVSFRERLHDVKLRAGDVILLQGPGSDLQESIQRLGILPLVERAIHIGKNLKVWLPPLIFILAIILAAVQVLPVQIAFALAVVFLILTNVINIKKVYESIDWSVIILLASMIPIGKGFENVGGTVLIASSLTHFTGEFAPIYSLIIVFVLSMTLSDIMNNSATAVMMAPIAVGVAGVLTVNPDTFLMAVAIGASCSFVTPIAHQNNTLVMGPGGYRFFDYFRLGFPLELVVLVTAIPVLLWVWPL